MSLVKECSRSWRGLTRSPALMIASSLTLALGIGLNAALFVALDGLLFRQPTGVTRPSQVFRIYMRHVSPPGTAFKMAAVASYGDFVDLQNGLRQVADVAGYLSHPDVAVRAGIGNRPVTISLVTSGYFSLLGVKTEHGRLIDFSSGNWAQAVVSHAFWATSLAGDTAIIGQTIDIGGRSYEVVGVAESNFVGLDADAPALWLPMGAERAFGAGPQWFTDHGGGGVKVVARPLFGASEARVTGAARTVASRLDTTYPDPFGTRAIAVGPLNWPSDSPLEGIVLLVPLMLVAITIAVLGVAMANVTYLLLVRAARRAGETGLHVALGATRIHIIRQHLLESLFIAGLGGAGAIILVGAVQLVFRSRIPYSLQSPLGLRVIGFAAVTSVAAGSVIGLAVAVWSSRHTANPFQSGRLTSWGHSSRMMASVTALQVATAVPLLVLTALLATSVQHAHGKALGFDPKGLVVASVSDGLGDQHLATSESLSLTADRFARLREDIAALPGVESAALGRTVPFGPTFSVGVVLPNQSTISVAADYVDEEFFRTLRLPLLHGRTFASGSQVTASGIVISRALDQRLRQSGDSNPDCVRIKEVRTASCIPIIGLVDDASLSTLSTQPTPKLYLPLGTFSNGYDKRMQIYVRVREITPAIIRDIDSVSRRGRPDTDAPTVATLASLIQPRTERWIVAGIAVGACGVLATILALVGLFGTTAFVVEQSKGDIAIRLALGATRGQIVNAFLFRNLKASIVGALVGSVLAITGGKLASTLLFNGGGSEAFAVSAAIASTFACLVATAIVPVRRASRMDLIGTLRSSGSL